MLRLAHRWPGLLAAILLVVLSLSGAALSIFPAMESLTAPSQTETNLDVGTLAMRVHNAYPNVEEIRRFPSGKISAYWFDNNNNAKAVVVNPDTGMGVGSVDRSRFELWVKDLHRSLFLGENGRIVMAVGASLMLALSISGLFLVARRTGGWKRFFSPLKGPQAGRIHVEIARFSVAGLLLSSLTALWMTAATFGFVPQGVDGPVMPDNVSGQAGYALNEMPALRNVPVSALQDLTFPMAGDPTDVFTLKTDSGSGYVDQGTGKMLAWADASTWDRVSAFIIMLHTGRGAALLGLALGLMALGVPAMAVTGAIQWWMGRRARPRIRGNALAGRADTIILVGSEGGSTWGFAATLHEELTKIGQHVHVTSMSAFNPSRYAHAKQMIVMAATYGDGDAPTSAKGFFDQLEAAEFLRHLPVAVLGFGDRSFPHFCGFAKKVEARMRENGWRELVAFDTVDRQSPQDFARWGKTFGAALGINLELHHKPVLPRLNELTLVSRRDYGAAVQAPAAILRFALPKVPLWRKLLGQAPRYSAGDLLGIVPEGSQVPRFYSLASSAHDGFAEVCVRKHPGGLCSSQLVSMNPGEKVQVFFRKNPAFRPSRNRKPVILIGAGTGIGPLAGFVRANNKKQAMHLFFGARHPSSDVFYAPEMSHWLSEGRLSTLTAAFSRTAGRAYVQDALLKDSARVAKLIASGAQIMVCGGADMAAGVSAALTDILAPLNLTTAKLKAQGRYAEDVY